MKNFITVVLCVSIFSNIIRCSDQLLKQQFDKVCSVLVSMHNKAFGKDNLFKQPLTDAEEVNWIRALTAIGNFVRENGDADQNDMWAMCVRGNTQLLKFIKMTLYGLHMRDKDPGFKSVFSTIIEQLENEIHKQKKQHYFLQSKKLTRKMLEHTAVMLITTMEKALLDAWNAALNR